LNGQRIADGYTNNDGFFGKEGLTAPQTYTILVVKDGYNDVEFNMTLKECKAYQESANMKSK